MRLLLPGHCPVLQEIFNLLPNMNVETLAKSLAGDHARGGLCVCVCGVDANA